MVLVVTSTPPEMLSVLGASRKVWPVGEVTTTARIDPSLPVITWLTVPIVAPVLLFTVMLVVRPGSDALGTAPRARTLFEFARLIARGLAWSRPWLLGARTVGVVVVVVPWTALLVFDLSTPCGDALIEPWLFTRASIPVWLGPRAPALTLAPAPAPAPPPAVARQEVSLACPGYQAALATVLEDAIERVGIAGTVRTRLTVRGGQVTDVAFLSGPKEYTKYVQAVVKRMHCSAGGSDEVQVSLDVNFAR